jgi:hypothetical protein
MLDWRVIPGLDIFGKIKGNTISESFDKNGGILFGHYRAKNLVS